MMGAYTAEIRNYLSTLPYFRLSITCTDKASQKLQRESHKLHPPFPEELLKLIDAGKGRVHFLLDCGLAPVDGPVAMCI